MFNLIFTILSALQQSVLLIAGLFVFGIGGLILLAGLQARRRGLRVTATIVGVRARGGMFYPVYSFILPTTGEEKQVTSRSGSNIRRGKETGRSLELFVDPDDPEKISGAGPWSLLAALCFVAPGLAMMYYSVATHRPDETTLLTVLIAAVYLGWKARKIILPKDRRLSPADWRAKQAAVRRAGLETSPVMPIEEVPPPQLGPVRLQQQRTTMRIAVPLLILIGLAMIGGGCYLGQKLDTLLKEGLRAPGQVVEMAASHDSDGSSYHAVVRFTDGAGAQHRFHDKVGSNPPSHVVGDAVTVLYRREDPEASAIIDRGWLNWLPPAGIALLGAIFLMVGAAQAGKLLQGAAR